MGTHPIFESDFDCLTALKMLRSGSIKTAARQASQYVDLSSWRSLIAVKGRDAFPLLQGVTTNDICNLEHVKCSYSMLLNRVPNLPKITGSVRFWFARFLKISVRFGSGSPI